MLEGVSYEGDLGLPESQAQLVEECLVLLSAAGDSWISQDSASSRTRNARISAGVDLAYASAMRAMP